MDDMRGVKPSTPQNCPVRHDEKSTSTLQMFFRLSGLVESKILPENDPYTAILFHLSGHLEAIQADDEETANDIAIGLIAVGSAFLLRHGKVRLDNGFTKWLSDVVKTEEAEVANSLKKADELIGYMADRRQRREGKCPACNGHGGRSGKHFCHRCYNTGRAVDPTTYIVSTGVTLYIDDRPGIYINVGGLSLAEAVAKAMFTHTGKKITPNTEFARSLNVLEINEDSIKVTIHS